MINIKQYIAEKFRISKNTSSSLNKYLLDKQEYIRLYNIVFDNTFRETGYSEYCCSQLADSIKSKEACIKYWLSLINSTKSIPYKYKSTIYSFPGNYGLSFIDKLFDTFDIDVKELDYLLNLYELTKDKEYQEFPPLLKRSYEKAVQGLINMSSYSNELSYELVFYNDISDYSEYTKVIFEKNKGLVIIPFILKYKNKKFKCEIIKRGSAYFNYKFEEYNYTLSSAFIERLKAEIEKS